MTVRGGCRCGAVRYTLALDDLPLTYACHCTDCQTWSGSAFSQQVLVPEAPEAVYVIYPKRQGFGLEAVPRELGSFENRRDLPAAWGGLEGDDLVAVTGVADALFCHAKRFLAVASSHEGIEQLARLALAGD